MIDKNKVIEFFEKYGEDFNLKKFNGEYVDDETFTRFLYFEFGFLKAKEYFKNNPDDLKSTDYS